MKLLITRSAQKELNKLANAIALCISRKILELPKDPYSQSEKLTGRKGYRTRVGKYRVVYTIDTTTQTITIIKIGHRREVYR